MKKVAKHLLVAVLILACLLPCFPSIQAQAAVPSLPSSFYLTQNVNNTCTLCSAAMMIRSAMYINGNSNWAAVTENALRPKAWYNGVGLSWFFSHTVGDTTVTVSHTAVSGGVTIEKLKQLLDKHPEGIVLYCGKLPHALFLTGYSGDVFYCADTVKGISGKQVTLKQSWLGFKYGSQAAVLKNVTAYWYVSDYQVNGQSMMCTCSTQYAGNYKVVSGGNKLRIRGGHGTSYPMLGEISEGEEVQVLRADGIGPDNWAHIIYNGVSGYASMKYLVRLHCDHEFGQWTASSDPGQEIRTCTLCGATESREAEVGQMGTVTDNDLRIRADAGTNFGIRGFLQKGDRVEIFETKQVGTRLWGRIEKGWIAMEYVKLDTAEPEPAPQTRMGTVTVRDLRIRADAGTNFGIRGFLQTGDRVEILETKQVGDRLWGRIEKGWIAMEYVQLDVAEPEPEIIHGTINTYCLRIRKEAGTDSDIAGYYYINTQVEILETKDVDGTTWGRTEKGWISMDYVTVT